jgi:trehalose 6-phosphate phosphatase
MSIQDLAIELPAPKPLRLGEASLFLDLDGTLAPIASRPQDVRPDPRRTSLLERLVRGADGRLAVVSGRTLADIDRILEGCVVPVAAVHGLVMRDPQGQLIEATPHPGVARAVAELSAFAARDGGLIVEDKGLSVALHFRLAPPYADAATTFAREIAARTGLALQEGDMVEELRTPGPSKGDSVRRFMDMPPFAGATPIFVGDDATDEDGFEAAGALGGMGIAVGRHRAVNAHYRLASVEAALAWLEAGL